VREPPLEPPDEDERDEDDLHEEAMRIERQIDRALGK
jgi:hypothetical protein